MARPRNGTVTLRIPPPVGGVNLATAADKLQPIEAVDLRGFEFDEYGVLGGPRAPKDLGAIVGGSTKVLSAYIFQRTSGGTQLLVHMDDGTLRYSTDFLTAAPPAFSTIASSLSTTAPFSFVTFLDKVWMGNATNDFRSWDGTTQVTFASAPKARWLLVWRDTLWMSAGAPFSDADRIYQSDAGDPTTWPALNFVDIDKGVGMGITGLHAVEAALIVFKHQKTYIVFDPVEYTNRVIDSSKGAISGSSVVNHNGLVYFVSHMGVCRFLGDGPSQIVSEKIAPLFDDLYVFGSSLATQLLDTAEETFIVGYSFENYVGWYIPNNKLSQFIKYFPDLPDKPWVFGTPMDPETLTGRACVVSVLERDKYQQLYKISGSPAKLWREYGETVSVGVSCIWRSAWFDFDTPMDEKYISMMQINFRGELLSILANRDFDNTTYKTLATNLTQTPSLGEKAVFTDLYARAIQFEFEAVASAERKQLVGSGLANEAEISRFQSGIAAVTIKAKMLGDMRR